MTDAPERIWAKPSSEMGWGVGYCTSVAPEIDTGTEYIRADIKPKVKPLVWDDHSAPHREINRSTNGEYEVAQNFFPENHYSVNFRGEFIGNASCLGGAIIIADKHNECRVLSALEF